MLIVGSGNVVHNLHHIAWDTPSAGFGWACRFDEAAMTLMLESPADILQLADHHDYPLAVPSPDHFIPLLPIAALAAAAGETPSVVVDGFAYGSLSMTCYAVGADCIEHIGDSTTGALPAAAPPEQSNL